MAASMGVALFVGVSVAAAEPSAGTERANSAHEQAGAATPVGRAGRATPPPAARSVSRPLAPGPRRAVHPAPAPAASTGKAVDAPQRKSRPPKPVAALLFNTAPTLAPVRLGQNTAGVVTGDLTVSDPEGDRFSVTVTQAPVKGSVVVDATGRYTYTPDAPYVQSGTTDGFSVTVSDAGSGFHLHGLTGLLNLLTFGLIGESGHTTTLTVPVVVYPTAPPPAPPSVERRIYATSTDSAITAAPGSGEAAHVVINPSPTVTAKGQLVVFLPGTQGKPEQYAEILRAAAGWGFHAIGLNYPNQTAVASLCANSSDANCFWNARTDVLFGDATPVSGQADVTVADSIVNRLDKVLLSLSVTYPAEGWDQFLLPDNTVDWNKVVLAGHSQGGGYAGVMAKTVSLGRAVYFSSPADWNTVADRPADWTSKPNVTPASRQYGFGSDFDPLVPNSTAYAIWDNLGLPEPATGPVLVDTVTGSQQGAPFGGSHQLHTALPHNPASSAPTAGLKNHGITVVDASTPRDGSGKPIFSTNGVWAYLLG